MSSQVETPTMGGNNVEGRKPRQEEHLSCLPVTVRAIQAATSGKADDVRIYGQEPSMLILVGIVENMTQQAASTEFFLNDGTGRIRAKYFATGSEDPFAGIESGRYVTLAAQLRTTPEPHVSVTAARAVRTADEISYHMIECAHAMLKLQKATHEPITPEKKKTLSPEDDLKITPPKGATDVSMGLATTVSTHVPPTAVAKAGLTGEALREAVLNFLRVEGETKPEGTSMEQLRAKFSSNSASELTALVQQLAESGEVFNTIDDDHFSVI